jgi:hypothetical protein
MLYRSRCDATLDVDDVLNWLVFRDFYKVHVGTYCGDENAPSSGYDPTNTIGRAKRGDMP